jgi:ribosome maturation factor RimP
MTHPVIPQVLELARPIGASLGLEVVNAVFLTDQAPPVLRIDIRHPAQDTGLADCERMTQALAPALDAVDWFPGAYILEISSPGLGEELLTERDFTTFQCGWNCTSPIGGDGHGRGGYSVGMGRRSC